MPPGGDVTAGAVKDDIQRRLGDPFDLGRFDDQFNRIEVTQVSNVSGSLSLASGGGRRLAEGVAEPALTDALYNVLCLNNQYRSNEDSACSVELTSLLIEGSGRAYATWSLSRLLLRKDLVREALVFTDADVAAQLSLDNTAAFAFEPVAVIKALIRVTQSRPDGQGTAGRGGEGESSLAETELTPSIFASLRATLGVTDEAIAYEGAQSNFPPPPPAPPPPAPGLSPSWVVGIVLICACAALAIILGLLAILKTRGISLRKTSVCSLPSTPRAGEPPPGVDPFAGDDPEPWISSV